MGHGLIERSSRTKFHCTLLMYLSCFCKNILLIQEHPKTFVRENFRIGAANKEENQRDRPYGMISWRHVYHTREREAHILLSTFTDDV